MLAYVHPPNLKLYISVPNLQENTFLVGNHFFITINTKLEYRIYLNKRPQLSAAFE